MSSGKDLVRSGLLIIVLIWKTRSKACLLSLAETNHFQTVFEKWRKLWKEPRYRLEHDRFLQRKEPIQHIL
jgi:hypothetical protein